MKNASADFRKRLPAGCVTGITDADLAALAWKPGHVYRVFAYGSLLWEPGFPVAALYPACLQGYHRSFCIRSWRYRGTREAPGLVLGLEPGGACHGAVLEIAADTAPASLAALWEREMSTRVYRPRRVPVRLRGRRSGENRGKAGFYPEKSPPAVVVALTFVALPGHPQYAPPQNREDVAAIIRRSHGEKGSNRDYLVHTLAQLERFGIADPELERLLAIVDSL